MDAADRAAAPLSRQMQHKNAYQISISSSLGSTTNLDEQGRVLLTQVIVRPRLGRVTPFALSGPR
jgi:hypothetical protein